MRNWTRHGRRVLGAVVVVVALAAALLAGGPGAGAAGASGSSTGVDGGRRSYTGTIDGAEYRVETPEHWNGTLVMYSHGYYPPHFPGAFPGIAVTNNQDTETWLLDHGFALAASNFRDVYGFQVEQGQRDQLALLDWFEENVGQPDRTISTGQSMGASIALLLAERHPDRFDGVATVCGGSDPQGLFNVGLDITFAVNTLLVPDDLADDVDLVRPDDPQGSTDALVAAVDAAMGTPEGRARLALIASFNNVTGWWSALAPRPTTLEDTIDQAALWLRNAYVNGFAGPIARPDLEGHVGGNPSFNVGVDYGRQLARSSQTELVEEAYASAPGVDLQADLAELAAAPRIAPDPAAVRFMYRTSVPTGRIEVPVVTLHSVGDGGAVPDQERWYAELVRRRTGDPNLVRQLYVERGQHCSTSAADEVVALGALLRRMDTGRWPSLSPHRLNDAVSQFDPQHQVVTDLSQFTEEGVPVRGFMPPAFVRFTPPRHQRPSL